MKISIPQPQFLKTLQAVEHAVNDRSTLPILGNILLETKGNELTLTATDLDVGIQCRFPLTAPADPGAVALPARRLTAVIRELPDELVTLESKKNHTATVNCGSSSFRIPGLPAEDFPVLPAAEDAAGVALPQSLLKQMIARTAHAMSAEETRFIFNGTFIAAQKNELTMAATDGRRLAVAKSPLNAPVKTPMQAVVPSKTVRELGRLLQDDDTEDITISTLKDNQLTFKFGPVTVITRLIEGQFPPYEKVIPPASKIGFTCDRTLLVNAIRRASLMTTAASQAVVFEIASGKLVVSKESAELGSAREELPVSYNGGPATIAFNPEYWLDVLKVIDGAELAVELAEPDHRAVIRRPEFTYLVLPIKVS